MNFLEETVRDIEESGHTPDDIIFIGSRTTGHRCTWAEFQSLANREYDDGFGAQKVAEDLEIVFSDGATMWRHEFDGSEWWLFSLPFTEPEENHSIKSLFVPDECVGWQSLDSINGTVVKRGEE